MAQGHRASRTLSHCAALVRERDRDRYLATLFAPAALRLHLYALQAFALELAAVRTRITGAMAGELRLQWWRDALDAVFAATPTGHPVADALGPAVEAGRLPRAAFEAMIDARTADLYDDRMPSLDDLEAYFGDTEAAIFRMSGLILDRGEDIGSPEAAGHAGVARGLTTLLTGLARTPWRAVLLPRDVLAARGVDTPPNVAAPPGPALRAALDDLGGAARRHFDEARRLAAGEPSALLPAYLPLATVPGDLTQVRRRPLAPDGRAGSLARQFAIWRAARRGRV